MVKREKRPKKEAQSRDLVVVMADGTLKPVRVTVGDRVRIDYRETQTKEIKTVTGKVLEVEGEAGMFAISIKKDTLYASIVVVDIRVLDTKGKPIHNKFV